MELNDEGDVVKLHIKPAMLKDGQYKLSPTYWVHRSNPTFKRRVFELEDSSGNLSPLIMLQYVFDGDPSSIEVKPHGRAKENPRPFFTTASGTRMKISQKACSSNGPSSIHDQPYQEADDVLSRKVSSDVPRSIDQVKYERKKLRNQHEKDQLAELISPRKMALCEMCKLVKVSGQFLQPRNNWLMLLGFVLIQKNMVLLVLMLPIP